MILKSPSEIAIMVKAADINREALEAVAAAIKPGVKTNELNRIAEDSIISNGGKPAFKGLYGYPKTLITSVNEVVVHGIPSDYALQEGDIVSVDIGTFYKGYAADMAKTFAVGKISSEAKKLIEVTEKSFYLGVEKAQEGNRLGDISAAIQAYVEAEGFWVIREFVGHGIGSKFHEAPEVANFGKAGTGPVLRDGLVLAIEPMVAQSRTTVSIGEDGWTAPTQNGCLASHYEHTVAITKNGPRILTKKGQPTIALASVGEFRGKA